MTSQQSKVLLVDGYIKEQEKLLKLSHIVPTSIYAIIFEYQLLFEIWNKELSDERLNISDDESCVDIVNDGLLAMCGDHIVKYGDSFEWELKLSKTDPKMENFPALFKCAVALVPNKENVLKVKRIGELSGWYTKGGYLWSSFKGNIYFGDIIKEYSTRNAFAKDGDVLQIKFNWKESTLHFIVNGNDFGNSLMKLTEKGLKIPDDKQAEFRLAVCVLAGKGASIIIQGGEI